MKNLIILITVNLFLQSCGNRSQDKAENLKEEIISNEDTIENNTNTDLLNPIDKIDDLPFELDGNYIFQDSLTRCKIKLTLYFDSGELRYKMETNSQTFADIAKISQEDDNHYITFQNIEWNHNLGKIDLEGNFPEEKLPLPTEIMAGLRNNEIVFQNYGNTENHYMILGDCDTKYIYLIKQKK